MVRSGDFMLREIAGDRLLIPVGEQVLSFAGLICLNETAAFVWKQLETPKSMEELTEAMCQEYEIAPDTAREDIEELLTLLREKRAVLD